MQPMTAQTPQLKTGDKFTYQGFTATVRFVWAGNLVQFSFTDGDGNVSIVRAKV